MSPVKRSAAIFNSFVIWSMNAVFGRARYRVKLYYKDGHRVVFDFTRAVTVYQHKQIDNGRELKVALGNLAKEMPEVKRYLCNGTLAAEPVCYLGRWKDI